jgi:hypothetical protein
VKVLWQLGNVQDIKGPRDVDEDRHMERRGDAELLCGSGEMLLDLVEVRLDVSSRSNFFGSVFSSRSDFPSRSNVLSRPDSSLLCLSRRLVSR